MVGQGWGHVHKDRWGNWKNNGVGQRIVAGPGGRKVGGRWVQMLRSPIKVCLMGRQVAGRHSPAGRQGNVNVGRQAAAGRHTTRPRTRWSWQAGRGYRQ